MKGKNKTLDFVLNLDLVIAGLSLIILISITFLGVIMRYLFNNPFVWQEEMQLWSFVWVVFFGGSAAFRSGSHVAIEFLVDLMPPFMKKIMEVIIYIVVMGVLFYFMLHGSTLVKQLIKASRTTNILDVPYPLIYGAFPLGCLLMMINYTVVTARMLCSKDIEMQGGE